MSHFDTEVMEALRTIQRAWLENRPGDMRPVLHPDVAMVHPGWSGSSVGPDRMVAGFGEFCESARVEAFEETELAVVEGAGAAVVTYRFRMVYERHGARYESVGRDLWVFGREEGRTLAIWRTMLELEEREL